MVPGVAVGHEPGWASKMTTRSERKNPSRPNACPCTEINYVSSPLVGARKQQKHTKNLCSLFFPPSSPKKLFLFPVLSVVVLRSSPSPYVYPQPRHGWKASSPLRLREAKAPVGGFLRHPTSQKHLLVKLRALDTRTIKHLFEITNRSALVFA